MVLDSSVATFPSIAGFQVLNGTYHRLAQLGGAGNTWVFESWQGSAGFTQTSATNATNVIVLDVRQNAKSLAILSAASGGTATLTVEFSIDGSTWLQADSIAAALTTVKQYTETTVGAGTYALSPLSFRWIRVTAGAAGVGNTTTLTIGLK